MIVKRVEREAQVTSGRRTKVTSRGLSNSFVGVVCKRLMKLILIFKLLMFPFLAEGFPHVIRKQCE